jgi:hypothetical protein
MSLHTFVPNPYLPIRISNPVMSSLSSYRQGSQIESVEFHVSEHLSSANFGVVETGFIDHHTYPEMIAVTVLSRIK